MTNEKIVVTGGSGFIGTNVVQYLMEKEYEVYNIDIVRPRNAEHLSWWKNIDINNYGDLSSAISEIEPSYIIHLAARTDLDGKNIDDYAANVNGVKNLLDIIKNTRSIKKVVLASSMLVCKVGYIPQSETDYYPTTAYGESKVETEKLIRAANLPCDWVIIRPTSIWGPWFGVPYRNFFDTIMKRYYFHIGNKSATMTYGFVFNAVYQICSLLFTDTLDKLYYIGDYEPTNLEEWSNEIACACGYNILKIPYCLIVIVAKVGDVLGKMGIHFPMTSFRLRNMTTNNICNMSSTMNAVPLLPYSRKDGVKITIDWMKQH